MRTTIDLPDELHRAAASRARDHGQTLSQTVADLVRRALVGDDSPGVVAVDRRTGLPMLRLGRPITTDDVRAAADE